MERANLFWAIVWFVIAALCIGGLCGSRVCLIVALVLAVGMVSMFVYDYIQERKLK